MRVERTQPAASDIWRTATLRCDTRRALTRAWHPAGLAAADAGHRPAAAQSPLAVEAGIQFEAGLARDGAAKLFAALRRDRGWQDGDCTLLDIADIRTGDPESTARARADATRRAVGDRLAGRPAPSVVWQPLLTLTVGGREAHVRPDLLLARSGDRRYTVGEIKAYPDLGPRTPAPDVASAAGQAAVGAVALLDTERRLGSLPLASDVTVELVLARAGTRQPNLRRIRVDREVAVLRRELGLLAPAPDPAVDVRDPAVVALLPRRHSQACTSWCELALTCRALAVATDDAALLGDDARDALAGVPLARAADAVGGDPDADVPFLARAGDAYRRAAA